MDPEGHCDVLYGSASVWKVVPLGLVFKVSCTWHLLLKVKKVKVFLFPSHTISLPGENVTIWRYVFPR